MEDGSIRRLDTSVACITADDVFAEVSEKWLDAMVKTATPDARLVVWAVTKLLPTEFALPGVWLGTDEAGERASRVRSLERFIESVLDACRRDSTRVDYRRVTVFDERQRTVGTRVQKDEDLLASIDNWMLRDPRVLPGAEFDRSENLLRELLKAYGKPNAIHSEPNARWDSLSRCFQDELAYNVKMAADTGTLPSLPSNSGIEILLFEYDFSSSPSAGDRKGAVMGGSKEFLDHRFEWEKIREDNMTVAVRSRLEELLSSGPKSGREILEADGWQTVKTWYCQNLHKRNEAWWTVMDRTNEKYFDPLRLKWNGAPVLTLELLLIGRVIEGKPVWQGAAIYNLSFDRTECTIQLVAKGTDLDDIGKVVEGVWEGKTQSDYGCWKDFPMNIVQSSSHGGMMEVGHCENRRAEFLGGYCDICVLRD